MILRKSIFFLVLLLLTSGPFYVYKLIWLAGTRQARGVVAFTGMGEAGEQMKQDYTFIWFVSGKDTIWFSGLGNLRLKRGDSIPIRYRIVNRYDARVDIFEGIWGDTLVYGGIPALMLLALFVHPKVVPWGSRLRLKGRKPFIEIIQLNKQTDI